MGAARKGRTRPRKKPQQERSTATVDAILQAAAYILIRDGWARFNTNRVAERAGVNIASLYQYFPNKEAIVVELQRRHVAKARAAMERELPGLRDARSLSAMLELIVGAGVDEHRVAPALHRVFSAEIPRSAQAPVEVPEEAVDRFWNELLGKHAQNLPDLEIASFIVRVTVHAVIHEAANSRPELLEDPRFTREVVTLLARYLRRPLEGAAR